MEENVLQTMIDSYIKLRDKKAEIKAEQQKILNQYNTTMEQIESFIMGHLHEQGLQSVATKAGTAFLNRKRSATVADKKAFSDFVISTSEFDLCDMRANAEAVADWIEANSGMLPPGINFSVRETVGVQRK